MNAHKRSGFSMLEVLVAMTIGTIVVMGVMSATSRALGTQRHIELRDDLEGVRQHLRQALSCETTLGATSDTIPAVCGGPIALRNKRGKLLTAPLLQAGDGLGSGKLGQWYLRAECDGTRGALVVRAARLTANAKFARDPLTGRTLDFSDHNRNVGNPIVALCEDRFGGREGATNFCPMGRVDEGGICTAASGELVTAFDGGSGRVCCTSVARMVRTYVVRNQGQNLEAPDQNRITASCDSGDRVIGGGGRSPHCDRGTEPFCGAGYVDRDSMPQDDRTWVHYVDHNEDTLPDTSATIAVCLDLPPFRH